MVVTSKEHGPRKELGPRLKLVWFSTSEESSAWVWGMSHGTPRPGEPRGALTGEGAAADAQVVVDELDAVQAAVGAAGVGEALVDVALTALAGKAGQAAAAVAPDPVHALAAVQAMRAPGAVVHVLFTEQAWRREGRDGDDGPSGEGQPPSLALSQ